MSWWDIILEAIKEGNVLLTPGRGLNGSRRKPFRVVFIENAKIKIKSGKSYIPLERECFDAIEHAFHNNPDLKLRVASLHTNPPLEGSADALIRNATGSNLSRGNYMCAILEHCGLVRYVLSANRKYIALQQTKNG